MITPQEAIKKLLEGNKRFIENKSLHPRQYDFEAKRLIKSQNPFAIILSCSDSRVPLEIIFDQGLGDLFVIRVAGNVFDDLALGSIEFAIKYLGTSLIMVLGHENCGAVTASVEAVLESKQIDDHTLSFIKKIRPAVKKVFEDQKNLLFDKEISLEEKSLLIDKVVRKNVALVVDELKISRPVIAQLIEQKNITIVGARYDLQTRKVTLLI